MITFAAQFEGFSTRATGDRILRLSTYEDQSAEVGKIVNGKIGQEYLVMMVPTDTPEFTDFHSETPEETRERFRKHMNSLINQVAEKEGKKPGEVRESFKEFLRSQDMIASSTNELSIEGYARAISILKKRLEK